MPAAAPTSFFDSTGFGTILGGLSGLLGNIGSTTGNTSGTTSGTSSSSGTGSSTPVLSDEQQMIANSFGNGLVNQFNQGTNLQPYQASGDQSINQAGNNNAANISNSLASRGLSYSNAAGTALTENRLNTVNQENQFNESIPLLQKQLTSQNLSQLVSGFSALPTGSTTTQTQAGMTNATSNQNSVQKTASGLLSLF
jgi:hypothetical protein